MSEGEEEENESGSFWTWLVQDAIDRVLAHTEIFKEERCRTPQDQLECLFGLTKGSLQIESTEHQTLILKNILGMTLGTSVFLELMSVVSPGYLLHAFDTMLVYMNCRMSNEISRIFVEHLEGYEEKFDKGTSGSGNLDAIMEGARHRRPARNWDQQHVTRLERIVKRASDGVLKFMTMTQEAAVRTAQDKLEFFLLLPKGSLKIGNEDHATLILKGVLVRELGLATLECLGSELDPISTENLHDRWIDMEKTIQSQIDQIFGEGGYYHEYFEKWKSGIPYLSGTRSSIQSIEYAQRSTGG